MEIVKRIPEELTFQVFAYLDHGSKISYYLDTYSYLLNKRDLSQYFTLQQLNNLYLHGVVDKLSVKRQDSNRRCLKNEITDLFPAGPSYTYVDEHGDEMTYTIMHPVHEIMNSFKLATVISSYSKIDVILRFIKSFQNISCEIPEVNVKIRGLLCTFLQSIIYYKRELNRRYLEKEKELKKRRQILFYVESRRRLLKCFKEKNGIIRYPFKMHIIKRSPKFDKNKCFRIKLKKNNDT